MTEQLKVVISLLKNKLVEAGFTPFEEYSDFDSIVLKGKMLGIYSVGGGKAVAEALTHDALKFCTETDYAVKIRLMGKCCGYTDYDKFLEGCRELFFSIAGENSFLFHGLELSGAVQTGVTKRLERVLDFVVRIAEVTEVNSGVNAGG